MIFELDSTRTGRWVVLRIITGSADGAVPVDPSVGEGSIIFTVVRCCDIVTVEVSVMPRLAYPSILGRGVMSDIPKP